MARSRTQQPYHTDSGKFKEQPSKTPAYKKRPPKNQTSAAALTGGESNKKQKLSRGVQAQGKQLAAAGKKRRHDEISSDGEADDAQDEQSSDEEIDDAQPQVHSSSSADLDGDSPSGFISAGDVSSTATALSGESSSPNNKSETISTATKISTSAAGVEPGSDDTASSGDAILSGANNGGEADGQSLEQPASVGKDEIQKPTSIDDEDTQEPEIHAISESDSRERSNSPLFVSPTFTEEEVREEQEDRDKTLEFYSKADNFPPDFVAKMQHKGSVTYELLHLFWCHKWGQYDHLFKRLRSEPQERIGEERRTVTEDRFKSLTTAQQDTLVEGHFAKLLRDNAQILDSPNSFFVTSKAAHHVEIPNDNDRYPVAGMSSQSSLGPRSSRTIRYTVFEELKAPQRMAYKADSSYDSPRSQHRRAQKASTIMGGGYGFDSRRDAFKRQFR